MGGEHMRAYIVDLIEFLFQVVDDHLVLNP